MFKLPVIIIGCGIGGLTMALSLAKHKIPSIALEQAPQIRETGAGIQLCPNVFKMFDHLEILEEMKKIAIFPDNLVYVDGISGKKFLTVSLKDELIKRFKYPYGVFHREDLLKKLAEICKYYPQIEVHTSSKVSEISEFKDHVEVITEDGRSFKGSVVIGADGLWSVARNFVAGNELPHFSHHVAYRGVVSLNNLATHLKPNDVVHWVRDNSHLVHYPIGVQGLLNIVAIIQTEKNYAFDDITGNREELNKRFEGSQGPILELLEHVNPDRKWLLFDRNPIKQWYKGRAVLIGDSAHPTLPYLTQGAGMAIEDAVILAQRLVDYEGNYEIAFREYQEERYLRTGFVQLMSRIFGAAHHSSGIARELRDEWVAMKSKDEIYDWLAKMYQGIEVNKKMVSHV
jgi:salicylate hydroxylase